MDLLNGTRFFEILVIIAFVILLAASLYMFVDFYICDKHTCKAFDTANLKGPEGSKINVTTLLGEIYNDGIWPIPYIGAAILTPLCLWFLSIPINIKTFAVVFLTSFVVVYFMFSFFGHHYVRPITTYVSEYIQDQCPAEGTTEDEIIHLQDDNTVIEDAEKKHDPFADGVGITFATPVNLF